jgi:hypothetical protein
MLNASLFPFYSYKDPYQRGYGQFCYEIQKNRIETKLLNSARSSTPVLFYLRFDKLIK